MEKVQRGFCTPTKCILFNDNSYLLTELKETTKHTPPQKIPWFSLLSYPQTDSHSAYSLRLHQGHIAIYFDQETASSA